MPTSRSRILGAGVGPITGDRYLHAAWSAMEVMLTLRTQFLSSPELLLPQKFAITLLLSFTRLDAQLTVYPQLVSIPILSLVGPTSAPASTNLYLLSPASIQVGLLTSSIPSSLPHSACRGCDAFHGSELLPELSGYCIEESIIWNTRVPYTPHLDIHSIIYVKYT